MEAFSDSSLFNSRLGEFKTFGLLIVIGTSRKSFIEKITNIPVHQRRGGSPGSACATVRNGADVIRCHDVKETKLALQLVDA